MLSVSTPVSGQAWARNFVLFADGDHHETIRFKDSKEISQKPLPW